MQLSTNWAVYLPFSSMAERSARGEWAIRYPNPAVVQQYGMTINMSTQYQRGMGVIGWESTAESNRYGRCEHYEGHYWHGASIATLMPRSSMTQYERLGRLGLYDARTTHPSFTDIRQYTRLVGGPWHRYWIGRSLQYATPDGQYHCCDMYVQNPETDGEERWAWYVLQDCVDPAYWYESRILWCMGMNAFPRERVPPPLARY